MSNPYLVSIIIPAYNAGNSLHKTIDSAINQTLKDIEIIVVDNASTDNTQDIIKNYMKFDKRVKLVVAKENHYAGGGRNLGTTIAQGEFIAYLDADDTFDTESLEILYKKAMKYNHDMIVFNYKTIFETGKIINSTLQEIPLNLSNSLMCNITLANWNKFYKRTLIQNNKIYFYEDIFCSDLATGLEFFYYAKNIGLETKSLYNYFFSENATFSTVKNKKLMEDIFIALSTNKKFLRNKNLFLSYKNEFLIRFLKQTSLICSRIENNPSDKKEQLRNLDSLIVKYNLIENTSMNFLKKLDIDLLKILLNLYLKYPKTVSSLIPKYELELINNHFVNIKILDIYIKCYSLYQRNITSIYVYGKGSNFENIKEILKTLKIKILGIIESNSSKNNTKYPYGTLDVFDNKLNNSFILINSISYKNDIVRNINKFSKKNNFKINYV